MRVFIYITIGSGSLVPAILLNAGLGLHRSITQRRPVSLRVKHDA